MVKFKKFLLGILASTTLLMSTSAVGAITDNTNSINSGKCPGCGEYTAAVTCSFTTAYIDEDPCYEDGHGTCTFMVKYNYDLHCCTNCTYFDLDEKDIHACVERHESVEYGAHEMMSVCPYAHH